jgi:hypothetical protein
MMAERGVTVSHENVREWCLKFGGRYTKRFRYLGGRLGDRWHLDEVFLTRDHASGGAQLNHAGMRTAPTDTVVAQGPRTTFIDRRN